MIVPHHSKRIVFYSKGSNSCGTWNGKGQLGCSSWTEEKTGPAKWNAACIVHRSGQSNKLLLLCYRGQKPQTPETLRSNSRGELSKIFETGHPFQTTILSPLYSSSNSLNSIQVIFSFSILTSSWWLPCILFFKSLSKAIILPKNFFIAGMKHL